MGEEPVAEAKPAASLSRRAVLSHAALGIVALSTTAQLRPAWALTPPAPESDYIPRPNPTQYVLGVGAALGNPDGAKPTPAVFLNGGVPGPEIRVREGELLRIEVRNQLPNSPTSIHWHGLLVPSWMDGVPDISNAPIPPGQLAIYEYPIRQSGTYWYHSHFGFQEQQGCYGAFIIEPRNETLASDHDAVVLLGDWLHRDPQAVFDALRSASPASAGMPGMGMKKDAAGGAMPAMDDAPKSGAPGKMEAGDVDLSDVNYDAFLLNGRAPADPWTLKVRRGDRVRLRVINGGSSTFFRLRLDGHQVTVTHADGLAVEAITIDHLLIGMGETYDLLVTIAEKGSFTLHAVAQDGSGQAIGVIHTKDAAAEPNRAMPRFDGRALSYADLRAPVPTILPPGPVRSFELPLGGDMARYVWSLGGQVWPKADPLRIRRGEHVEIVMRNDTMMWHPMHLHGHFFRLLQGAGDRSPLKHTVNVAPRETVRIAFTADNPGSWFFHCHNLYHLEAGMARKLEYVVD